MIYHRRASWHITQQPPLSHLVSASKGSRAHTHIRTYEHARPPTYSYAYSAAKRGERCAVCVCVCVGGGGEKRRMDRNRTLGRALTNARRRSPPNQLASSVIPAPNGRGPAGLALRASAATAEAAAYRPWQHTNTDTQPRPHSHRHTQTQTHPRSTVCVCVRARARDLLIRLVKKNVRRKFRVLS